jgi:zinc transport system substrate-binding protein
MVLKVVLRFVCLGIGVLVASCVNRVPVDDDTLMVSIEPLRYIIEEITGDDFEVAVLVPQGASPETYEPTPLQIKAAEDAELVFSTGLIDFENSLLEHLPSPELFVDLSAGITLIAAEEEPVDGHKHSDRTHGGIDPHIWVAPKALMRMAATAYGRIHELYPDSVSYTVNYTRLTERLNALDKEVAGMISASLVRSFAIFHPGLTYYARDYGLQQIAIESDGKEPSAGGLADMIVLARAGDVSTVLYQSEFPRQIVEVVATEIGAEPAEIDLLGYDIVGNILKITELITEKASNESAISQP